MIDTDERRAWCAMQWCCGHKQREIAAALGIRGAPQVNIAIGAFLRKYGNRNLDAPPWTTGEARKRLVPPAMAEYVRRGGAKPRLRLRAET